MCLRVFAPHKIKHDGGPAAKTLAAEFGIHAEPRFEGIKDASPGVLVIVTKDYGRS